MTKNICGIIILDARSPQEAKKLAQEVKNCPHLLASGTSGRTVYSVYIKPEEQRWWLKYPESHPEVTGAKAARVHVVDELTYPDQFVLHLPATLAATAPCGADCPTCPLREKYDCSGCPATIHYQGCEAGRQRPQHGTEGTRHQ